MEKGSALRHFIPSEASSAVHWYLTACPFFLRARLRVDILNIERLKITES